MSESESYPKAEFFLKIYRRFRSVDWTYDMIIVKWREVTVIQFFRKPNLSEYLLVRIFTEYSEVWIEHTTW